MTDSGSLTRFVHTCAPLGPERLATGIPRRPPGLLTDVDVDAELRRSRQIVRAFSVREAAHPRDGDFVGPAYARPAADPRPSAGAGALAASTTYQTALVPWWLGAVLLAFGLAFLAAAVLL